MKINPSEYKILVVDDAVANVLLLQVLLGKEGFNIITANNGKNAIDLIVSQNPDLILLDILMPVMDGFGVVEELKKDSKYREIPILFLTALDNSADIVKGFQLGISDYITKPFNKAELMVRIIHQLSLLAAKRTIVKRTKELRNTIIARDKMYSVIAHDLRSPMTSVKMIMNLLTQEIKSEAIGAELYDLLHNANRTTEEIYSLLDNLLKWTRSKIGKLNAVFQTIDLVVLVRGIVNVFNDVAIVKNIKIEFQTLPDAEILVDIEMIKSSVRNLITNAIKFSYNNSTIKVTVGEDVENYIISVADNGCGIPDAAKPKLLNVDSHYTTYGTAQEEGSGLGLLLTYEFMVRNNGRLWFESQEGVGSVFYLSIPKIDEKKLSIKD